MKPARTLIVSAVFLAIAAGVAVWLYPRLPAQVPVHWNPHGRIDRYGPRGWVAAMPALLIAGIAVLTVLLPAISPRRFEIAPFARVYGLLMLVIQGMFLVIGLSVLLVGAGYPLPVPAIAMLAIGALFMVLGNYMGKLRKNFFVGIRTPWTLSSDAVWERTHRMGGWLFMLGGLVAVVATLAGAPWWIALSALIAAALLPVAYSFWIYRTHGCD
ncbi:SdpI family protein [Fulvimonas sp. R45]|uniref:SdpI family protein n=1 Tax=Fulvimonas sp. R45 TaxID=3045937 RepID=UPI00265F885A|nr:SdpI family protein [Fulvimonas sp. R45]MDO1528019.1 SdpI family protein [Fulvimonas sp. R45]